MPITSIRIAYKLWQFGFKNINIIRTYTELGKDITDCSVKLKDDILLVKFIELWYKDAFKFKPASDEDFDSLIETKVYTQDTALKIDPRDIKKEIEFAIKYNDIKDFIGFMDKDISKNPIGKLKNGDINFIHELVLRTKDNLDNKVIGNTLNSETTNISLEATRSAVKTVPPTENNSDTSFIKLSDKQVFCLQKKFNVETIKNIDEYLTDKQINSVMWKIRESIEFDIFNYLMSSKYKENLVSPKDDIKDNTPKLNHTDKDLTPISNFP